VFIDIIKHKKGLKIILKPFFYELLLSLNDLNI